VIDPTTAAQAATTASPASGAATSLGQLDSDAFLKLMVAQLRYQDPMAPADGAAMMDQTAQFTQVETMQQLVTMQQQLMALQQTAIGSDLIGHEVTAVTETGAVVTGTVDGMRFTDVGPLLQIGDQEIPIENAQAVRRTTT
jgi:flagellar basal-body rod modification protein FlgD